MVDDNADHLATDDLSALGDTAGDSAYHNDCVLDIVEGVQPQQIISSMLIGLEFSVYVFLPIGYTENHGQDCPVIYTMDGQWLFNPLSDFIDESSREIIVVSIHFPEEDRRPIDYAKPGSLTYFDFMRDELLPVIEYQYRIDAADQVYVGNSLGGMLGATIMLTDDNHLPKLERYPLLYPPFEFVDRQEIIELEQLRFDTLNELNVDVLVTTALVPNNRLPLFNAGIEEFFNRMQNRGFEGFSISKREFDDQTRFTIASRPCFGCWGRFLLTPNRR